MIDGVVAGGPNSRKYNSADWASVVLCPSKSIHWFEKSCAIISPIITHKSRDDARATETFKKCVLRNISCLNTGRERKSAVK